MVQDCGLKGMNEKTKKKKKIETTDPNSGEIRGSSMQVESRMCVCMHVYRQTNNGVCLVKKRIKEPPPTLPLTIKSLAFMIASFLDLSILST